MNVLLRQYRRYALCVISDSEAVPDFIVFVKHVHKI